MKNILWLAAGGWYVIQHINGLHVRAASTLQHNDHFFQLHKSELEACRNRSYLLQKFRINSSTGYAITSHGYTSYQYKNETLHYHNNNQVAREKKQEQNSRCAAAHQQVSGHRAWAMTDEEKTQILKLGCHSFKKEDWKFRPPNPQDIETIEFSESFSRWHMARRFRVFTEADSIKLSYLIEKTGCPATTSLAETNFIDAHHGKRSKCYTGQKNTDDFADSPQVFSLGYHDHKKYNRPAKFNFTLQLPKGINNSPSHQQLLNCLHQGKQKCHFISTWNTVFNMKLASLTYCPETESEYQENTILKIVSSNHEHHCLSQMLLPLNLFFILFPVNDERNNTTVTATHDNHNDGIIHIRKTISIPCMRNSHLVLNASSKSPLVQIKLGNCPNKPWRVAINQPDKKRKFSINERLEIDLRITPKQYGLQFIQYQYYYFPSKICAKPLRMNREFRLVTFPQDLIERVICGPTIISNKNLTPYPFKNISFELKNKDLLHAAQYHYQLQYNGYTYSQHQKASELLSQVRNTTWQHYFKNNIIQISVLLTDIQANLTREYPITDVKLQSPPTKKQPSLLHDIQYVLSFLPTHSAESLTCRPTALINNPFQLISFALKYEPLLNKADYHYQILLEGHPTEQKLLPKFIAASWYHNSTYEINRITVLLTNPRANLSHEYFIFNIAMKNTSINSQQSLLDNILSALFSLNTGETTLIIAALFGVLIGTLLRCNKILSSFCGNSSKIATLMRIEKANSKRSERIKNWLEHLKKITPEADLKQHIIDFNDDNRENYLDDIECLICFDIAYSGVRVQEHLYCTACLLCHLQISLNGFNPGTNSEFSPSDMKPDRRVTRVIKNYIFINTLPPLEAPDPANIITSRHPCYCLGKNWKDIKKGRRIRNKLDKKAYRIANTFLLRTQKRQGNQNLSARTHTTVQATSNS